MKNQPSHTTSASATTLRLLPEIDLVDVADATLPERLAGKVNDQLGGSRLIDGFDLAGHTMVGALGVTTDGTKVPLGVIEGSTDNKAVVRHLITGLRDRGLDATEGSC